MSSTNSAACPVCGCAGQLAHEALLDLVFGSPGTWTLFKCSSSSCMALWLYPRPNKEALAIAYSNYYTHEPAQQIPSVVGRLGRWAKRISGVEQRRNQIYMMYLTDASPGRLLDIGCGNGERLLRFQAKGWDVEGQEVDPAAHAVATAAGLRVHLGQLSSLGLQAATYDAIVMNHVIEHVADVRGILAECRRLLAPAGRLVMTTPNSKSLGYKLFGRAWRGLEPPRHLIIHSPDSLRRLCSEVGFGNVVVTTDTANGHYFFLSSFGLLSGVGQSVSKKPLFRLLSWALYWVANALVIVSPSSGEEAVVVARTFTK